eukprot:scaffold302_cov397-Prasinococcus_capsulatus_cf.AAC.13
MTSTQRTATQGSGARYGVRKARRPCTGGRSTARECAAREGCLPGANRRRQRPRREAPVRVGTAETANHGAVLCRIAQSQGAKTSQSLQGRPLRVRRGANAATVAAAAGP